jgi:protoporphyrinogen oxidase
MTVKVKYLIMGAGASGLSLAVRLLQHHETSFLILEKEVQAGGLSRSMDVDGSPLDIGGGHFLDVRSPKVLHFVFQFLPENEWQRFDRISKIKTAQFEMDYPYEANIWQLPVEDQVEHLLSIKDAPCNQGKPMPASFREWIVWKLGRLIAENYMLPYNAKVFGDHLDQLGTYWLYKLPNVSFEDTLRSCLYHRPYGQLPGHAQFLYPRQYGYGEIFLRMAELIGNKLLLNSPVNSFDAETLTVNGEIRADRVINTIPWQELRNGQFIPIGIKQAFDKLAYSSIDIIYRQEVQNTPAHWTYYPDESLPFHRIISRHNFLKEARGYWEEVNANRTVPDDVPTHHNQYAYPLNTIEKPQTIREIREWAASMSITGLGRWGEWEHMNSDVAMEKAISLADHLVNFKEG